MTRFARPRSMWPREGAAAYEIAWAEIGGCASRPESVSSGRAWNAGGRAISVVVGAALGLGVWSGVAEAHGEAEWIRDMQLGCCGPTDCTMVPDGTWIRQEDGYLHTVTGEFIEHAEAKASVDEHFWECRYGNGRIRSVIAREGGMCLFVPSIGF